MSVQGTAIETHPGCLLGSEHAYCVFWFKIPACLVEGNSGERVQGKEKMMRGENSGMLDWMRRFQTSFVDTGQYSGVAGF